MVSKPTSTFSYFFSLYSLSQIDPVVSLLIHKETKTEHEHLNSIFQPTNHSKYYFITTTEHGLHMINRPFFPIKLDRNNHILWKTQMENVMYANAFEEHIKGLRTYASNTNTTNAINPKFLTQRCFDHMIRSWIYSSLTSEIMGQIIGYQISNTTWTTLEKKISTSSKAKRMQLRLAFQTTQKGSLSMMEYILKLKTLADNLAVIREPVTEVQDQILQLLGALGANYNSIVINFPNSL